MVKGAFDDVTLARVAEEAGVSLKTVTRQFGTKEELIRSTMTMARGVEEGRRVVRPGDLGAVVEILSGRYDEMAGTIYRMGEAELRWPWLSEWIQMARESHLAWLEAAFAPWMPPDDAVRGRRVACLFVATEVRSWWTLRNRLGHSRESAADVMRATLEALVARWATEDALGRP
jgi:AcrR family transcriptional regulator